jgi:hypothetical protein
MALAPSLASLLPKACSSRATGQVCLCATNTTTACEWWTCEPVRCALCSTAENRTNPHRHPHRASAASNSPLRRPPFVRASRPPSLLRLFFTCLLGCLVEAALKAKYAGSKRKAPEELTAADEAMMDQANAFGSSSSGQSQDAAAATAEPDSTLPGREPLREPISVAWERTAKPETALWISHDWCLRHYQLETSPSRVTAVPCLSPPLLMEFSFEQTN